MKQRELLDKFWVFEFLSFDLQVYIISGQFAGLSLASLGDDGLWADSGGEQDELGGGWDGFDAWGSDGY